MGFDQFEETPIVAQVLEGSQRMRVLPQLFGRHMIRFEGCVYGWMGKLANTYDGGYWEMYRLSNGGFYMAPFSEQGYLISVESNLFEGELSADSAGIVATLFALNQLTWETEHPKFVDLYRCLQAFAAEHPEAGLIFRAID